MLYFSFSLEAPRYFQLSFSFRRARLQRCPQRVADSIATLAARAHLSTRQRHHITMQASLGSRSALRAPAARPSRAAARPVVVRAAAAAAEVPDMNKRNIMNLVLLGGIGLPVAGLAGPYALFFVPKTSGGGSGGQAAKDALGNDVKANAWLATHQKGDRSLAQGLKGDPTYLVVTADGGIEKYGLNAVCTHLGCVVPWVGAENKFKCPCHGSQYDSTGKKIRGPAPLSLALAHTTIAEDDTVLFSTWTETDFRTGEAPWWK